MERGDRIKQRIAAQSRSRRGGMDAQNIDEGRMREDIGIRMTNKGYEQFTEGEEKYNTEYASYSEKLKAADKKLSGADRDLDRATKRANDLSVDKEWDKVRKGFTKVNVWSGNNAKKGVEGSYYLPKEMVDNMNSSSFNQGDGSFTGSYVGKEYYVHVVPRGGEDAYGKELHEMIGGGERDVKDKFWQDTEPLLTKAQKEALGILAGQRDLVKGERNKVKGYWDELTASKAFRDQQKADAAGDYEEKKKVRGRALGGAL